MSDPGFLVDALRIVTKFATDEGNERVARWCGRHADMLAADDKVSIEIGRQLYELANEQRVTLVERDYADPGDEEFLILGRKARMLATAAEVKDRMDSDSAVQEARL